MIELKNKIEKWFAYDYEGDILEVKLRFYPQEIQDKHRQECTIVDKDGNEVLNEEEFAKKMIDYTVVDWNSEHFQFDGNPSECNLENKIKLIENYEPIATDWAIMAQSPLNYRKPVGDILKNFAGSSDSGGNGKVETEVG